MSYDDLFRIVSKLALLINDANRGSDSTSIRWSRFEVSGHGSRLAFGPHTSDADLARAPSPATDVQYTYYQENAPISDVSIHLYDFTSDISVEGTDPNRVEAILSAVSEDFRGHSTWLSGFPFRVAVAILSGVLASLLLGNVQRLSGWKSTSAALSGLALLVLAVLMPVMSQWFPGTAVYRGDASFIVRNAAQISFAAFVLAPIFFIISFLQTKRLADRPGDDSGVNVPKAPDS
jgi:hypothetical protein